MNHPALEIDYDPSDELKLRYELLRQQQPNLRAHAAAQQLKVSEAELVACRAGDTSYQLVNRPEAIISALETVGEVLVVTRNETTVIEKKGSYKTLSFSTQGNLQTAHCSGDGLELRILLNNWRYGFLVIDEQQPGRDKSLQFFDNKGQAVHKVYLTQNTLQVAFEKIITHFISSDQPTYLDIARQKHSVQSQLEQDIKWHKIRENWQDMQSSYDFFQRLIGSQVSRQQAYDNVGSELAYEIMPGALHHLIALAKNLQCHLTFALGNQGCIQFHSSQVHKTNEYGSWFNILNADFNLHINTHKLTQAWVVRKPLNGAPVTSVEFFDSKDQLALQITAQRTAGMPEPDHWQEMVAQLQPRSLGSSALSNFDKGMTVARHTTAGNLSALPV